MKIALRFNAGSHATPRQVPKSRLKVCARGTSFSRPFGTRILPTLCPALKRRAIIGCPFGTSFQRIPERH